MFGLINFVSSEAQSYLPVLLQIGFVLFFVGGMVALSSWLGPKRKTADKLENFSSGIINDEEAREPMSIKYLLIAILFVLFDVEIIFFYPYAVNFAQLGWNGFYEILIFICLILVGFFYILKKKALTWDD